jgi:hypothetical protein
MNDAHDVLATLADKRAFAPIRLPAGGHDFIGN